MTRAAREAVGVDTHVSTLPLMAALEDGWRAIRENHPELPSVVLMVAPGTDGKRKRWGYFARERWSAGGTTTIHEIMIAGESLARTANETFATLLHEAAHCLGAARGTINTSRGGRYHNTNYRDLAGELGLRCEKSEDFGWTITTITTVSAQRYKPQIAALAAAQGVWRLQEPEKPKSKTSTVRLRCGCEWSIAASPAVAERAKIRCEDCGELFKVRL